MHGSCVCLCASVCVYLGLRPGAASGLVVLGQQQLLIQQVHPLLPLDVQRGAHPQGALAGGLRA